MGWTPPLSDNAEKLVHTMLVRIQSQREEKSMKNLSRIGIDIAKNFFHIHGVDSHERVQWQAKLPRARWINELCQR